MRLIQTAAQKIDSKEMISQADLRKITIWLAGSLLHCNAQRPGAVTNTTVSGCHSLLHRTRDIQNDPGGEPQNCHNRQAKLTADRSLTKQLDLYVAKIRPALEGSETQTGRAKHLSRHVENLATKLGIKLPRRHRN